MDENEYEVRNDAFDEEERNAMRNALEDVRNRRKRPVGRPTQVTVYQPAPSQGQWSQSAPLPPQVVVAQPVPAPQPKGLFGNVTKGQLVNIAAMALAVMSPLPPEPTVTGDSKKDDENLIRYQKALAEHAKRNQQIVTIGAIAGIVL